VNEEDIQAEVQSLLSEAGEIYRSCRGLVHAIKDFTDTLMPFYIVQLYERGVPTGMNFRAALEEAGIPLRTAYSYLNSAGIHPGKGWRRRARPGKVEGASGDSVS
jgi:hypothetical protein